VINCINTNASSFDSYIIQFGNGEELDIGDANIRISKNSNIITFEGKVTFNGEVATVWLDSAVSIISKADIKNTGTGKAIEADTAAHITISAGTITGIIYARHLEVDNNFSPGSNEYTVESTTTIANAAKFLDNFKYIGGKHVFVPKSNDLVLRQKFIVKYENENNEYRLYDGEYTYLSYSSSSHQGLIDQFIEWDGDKIIQLGDGIENLPDGDIEINSSKEITLTGKCTGCNIRVINGTIYVSADVNSVTSVDEGQIILSGSPAIGTLAGNNPIQLDSNFAPGTKTYKLAYPDSSIAVSNFRTYFEMANIDSRWQ